MMVDTQLVPRPMDPALYSFTRHTLESCCLGTLTDRDVQDYLPPSPVYHSLYVLKRAQGATILAALEAVLTTHLLSGTGVKRTVSRGTGE